MNEKIQFLYKKKHMLQAFSLAFLVGLIFCLIMAIKAPKVGGLFAAIMLFTHIFGIRPAAKRYVKTVKIAHIQEGMRTLIKQLTYHEKKGIPTETIVKAGFLPVVHPNNIVIRDTVKGTYQAMPIFLTDVTTDYESQTTTNKSGLDYLAGCYLEIKLSKKPDFDFVILSGGSVPASAFEKQCATLTGTNIHIDGKEEGYDFRVYAPEGKTPANLPKDTMTAFSLLYEYTPGMPALQVKGNYARIFIRNRFLYTHDLKQHTPVTPQLLGSNPFPELNAMLRIIDTLK